MGIYVGGKKKENSPNLVKEIDMQVQEARRVPDRLDPKRNTSSHITIKIPNVKDKEGIFIFNKQQEKSRELPPGQFP